MNRILWIDPVNRMACIEAGAVGRHIQAQLAQHGFTMGHEPDSVEFSTLGGWIATHASGMKKNRYGNIEDIVLDVHVVTARGRARASRASRRANPSASTRAAGSSAPRARSASSPTRSSRSSRCPKSSATTRCCFPTSSTGVAFLYDLTREATPPASVRLVDNLQFQLGQTLKPKATGREGSRAPRREVVRDDASRASTRTQMVACTLVFEGSRAEVAREEART